VVQHSNHCASYKVNDTSYVEDFKYVSILKLLKPVHKLWRGDKKRPLLNEWRIFYAKKWTWHIPSVTCTAAMAAAKNEIVNELVT
jgi:hypothetical protein